MATGDISHNSFSLSKLALEPAIPSGHGGTGLSSSTTPASGAPAASSEFDSYVDYGVGMTTNEKIHSTETLAAKLAERRRNGQRIVLCHGVFDLIHPGHVRHLAAAKRHGDVLVVAIAADHAVNKGPGRPVFPAALRAENVAALQDVDLIAVDHAGNTLALLRLLQPDVYVVGRNGAVNDQLAAEEAVVREAGGTVEYTSEVSFSSSKLLNDMLPVYPPEVHAFLNEFRGRHRADRIIEMVESLKDLRVMVVGEAILDEYIYGTVIGKSGKEPILAMRYASRETHAGGSVAIANHLAEFCKSVDLVTYLGDVDSHENLIRGSIRENVVPHFVYKPNSPTIVKRRFVENYLVTKLLEVYEMNDLPLEGEAEERFCSTLESRLPDCDVVIAADYGHGLITPKAVKLLSRRSKFLAVNTQVNAANIGFHTLSKYPKAHFACVHEGEVRLDCRDRSSDVRELVTNLVDRMTGRAAMVTRGKFGTLLYRPEEGFSECPALAVKVVDRVGAGDSLLAISSLCMARDWPLDIAGFVANMVGAQAVRIVGNRSSVRRDLLLQGIESILR